MTEHALKQQVSDALMRGDMNSVESLCDQIARQLGMDEAAFVRGVVRSAQGRMDEAHALLDEARQSMPARGDIAYNHGVVLQRMGRMDDAVAAWRQSVASDASNAAAWLNLALGVAARGDTREAKRLYAEALALHPAERDLLYNYANLLQRDDDAPASLDVFRTLTAFYPRDAAAWINYGMALKTLGQTQEAEACYYRAIALNSAPHTARALFNLANLLLQQGRWREGFIAHEARFKMPDAIKAPWNLPAWTPDLPQGSRVLLWSDQGLGDALMFTRFAALFAAKGFKLAAFVQPPLKEIIAAVPGIEAAFTPLDEPQNFDASLPIGSLPFALELDDISVATMPYISASVAGACALPARQLNAKRVGLVWAGNPSHANDVNRSMKLADFAPLLGLPDIEWYSLQVGAAAAELASSPWQETIHDLSPRLTDFAATAAFMAQLDLVISVDTAPAHLAGAMGRATWIALPATGTDWRWGTAGADSAWYPSARLFRQERPHGWSGVIAAMARNLVA